MKSTLKNESSISSIMCEKVANQLGFSFLEISHASKIDLFLFKQELLNIDARHKIHDEVYNPNPISNVCQCSIF